jgi:nitrite reductase/ring-hydroxylating ferredoxin subunit
MGQFVKLASLDDLPSGSAREVEHDGRIFALFHIDGRVWAIDGICPHQGGPLAEGVVEGSIVTCPWHGWQFDIQTGQSTLGKGLRQATFPTKVEDGQVLVEVP